MMRYVIKLSRKTAWLLLIISILALISGFIITNHLPLSWPTYNIFYYIHTVIAPLAFILLLYIHSITAILIWSRRHKKLNSKYARILLGITWTGVFIIFSFIYFVHFPLQQINSTSPAIQSNPSPHSLSSSSASGLLLTLEEVSKHNSPEDCWLIINGKVYDVTNYLNFHPGGPETIIPYCGRDATQAFNTMGGRGHPHSPRAYMLLSQFYIGDLGSSIDLTKLNSLKNHNVLKAVKSKFKYEHEDDERYTLLKSEEIKKDVLREILDRFPGAQILKIKAKRGLYEIKLIYESLMYEVKIDANGKIVKVELED